MRLNIGCGGRRIPGYTGVDAVERPAADIVSRADSLPMEDASVDEVMAIHLVEHLHPWELPIALAEWFRVLKHGGRLVLEMPDLIKCCQNIISGRAVGGKDPDQLGMWGCYGDPRGKDPYMAHKWGYTFATINPILRTAGFDVVTEHTTQWHPAGRKHRDFRVEAIKP